MRTFALVALLAATVYADGHLPTNSTMPEDQQFAHHDEHHEDHEGDEMNTAEQLFKAVDDIMELFMEEADLIHEGKINPKALEGAADFKALLEMVCEVGHDEEHHDEDHHDEDHHEGEEHHEDADHNRMLDGHENAAAEAAAAALAAAHEGEHDMNMDMGDDSAAQCMRAYRLLHSMEEYAKEDTTDERREEISAMWSQGLDDAWAEMFEGASTIAASIAGLATAVAVLSF